MGYPKPYTPTAYIFYYTQKFKFGDFVKYRFNNSLCWSIGFSVVAWLIYLRIFCCIIKWVNRPLNVNFFTQLNF